MALNTHAAQSSYNPNYNQGAIGLPTGTPVPRTLASAISRMESLNTGLAQVHNQLSGIADIIGALRNAKGEEPAGKPAASGAIHRLNDSADYAHSQLSDIESLLSAIASALG